VSDDVRLGNVQGIQQKLDVVGEVDSRVATLRFVGSAVAADVDDDEPIVLGQIGNQRHPVARVIGVAVDQNDGGTLGITHVDVGQVLAVGQQHHLFQRIEFVEIDLQGRRFRGQRDAGQKTQRSGQHR